MIGHPRQLDNSLQCQLAPAPTYLRGAESGDQVRGFLLELFLRGRQRLDVLLHACIGFLAALLQPADVLVELLEGLGQRLDESVDGLLAFSKVTFGLGKNLVEGFLGQCQECRRATVERVTSDGLEGVREFGLRFRKKILLLFKSLHGFRQLGFGPYPGTVLAGQLIPDLRKVLRGLLVL